MYMTRQRVGINTNCCVNTAQINGLSQTMFQLTSSIWAYQIKSNLVAQGTFLIEGVTDNM